MLGITMRAVANLESKGLSDARAITIGNVMVSVRNLDETFGWHRAITVYSPSAAAVAKWKIVQLIGRARKPSAEQVLHRLDGGAAVVLGATW